jgi:hypothetical protein
VDGVHVVVKRNGIGLPHAAQCVLAAPLRDATCTGRGTGHEHVWDSFCTVAPRFESAFARLPLACLLAGTAGVR